MAGLKKAPPKRNTQNPNTVLVVFLVLFVLLSIGLGVAMYYGYAGQDQLKKSADDAQKEKAAFKLAAEFMEYRAYETIQAIGTPPLNAERLGAYTEGRAKVLDENSVFKNEPTRTDAVNTAVEYKKILGYDEQAKKYNTTFMAVIKDLTAERDKFKAMADAEQRQRAAADERFKTLLQKHDEFRDRITKKTTEYGNIALGEAKKRDELIKTLELANERLRNSIKVTENNYNEEKEKLKVDITQLQLKINEMKKAAGEAAVANPRGGGQMHALIMDVSSGRPLWDSPLGKITRVETQDRRVIINLGSGDGVRPELTFNVFGAGRNNRADKSLKGTIEVIRVLDANTSVARITSLYDAEGHEIATNDSNRRIQREADNPIKEGDLLFNVFWGSHVAIAGKVRWADFEGESPAEQMRSLTQFMQLLQRQGVIIDAYLDLADGTIKGAITARTRYLILGDPLGRQENAKAAPMEEEKKDEAKKEVKEEKAEEKAEGAKGVGLERMRLVDEAREKMKAESVDRGMMIVSPQIYAAVVGFRAPRSANRPLASGFVPSLPSSGGLGANPAAAPREEK